MADVEDEQNGHAVDLTNCAWYRDAGMTDGWTEDRMAMIGIQPKGRAI